MKLLQSKAFLKQLSILSPIEKLEVLDLLIKVENNIPYIEENISPNVLVILYRYIKKYQEHKNKVSDIRRLVRWVNKDKIPTINTTIVKEFQNNCTNLQSKSTNTNKNNNIIQKDTTIVKEFPSNCTDSENSKTWRFPECPWKDTEFPKPDIELLIPAPEKYTPHTEWFWDIFITLNLQALNDLPHSWHEIARDIDDRIAQIEKIQNTNKQTSTSIQE